MPPYSAALQRSVNEAIALARAGDLVVTSVKVGAPLRRAWHFSRVELLYELAYLRIFIEWESCLEQTFLRYLCGYASVLGTCTTVTDTKFYHDLATAQAAVLGGRQYALWHNPGVVILRAKQFFQSSFHETVVASNLTDLGHLAAIRHRIAHGQDDAKQNFDAATMNFAGRRYFGARAGRFLRDWDRTVTPQRRWIETLGSELVQLAQQIA